MRCMKIGTISTINSVDSIGSIPADNHRVELIIVVDHRGIINSVQTLIVMMSPFNGLVAMW